MFYDLTMPIYPGQLVWPGDPAVEVIPFSSIASGDKTNLSKLNLGTHSGTHIDAPRHILKEGEGIDRILPDKLIGRCQLLDLEEAGQCINSEEIQKGGFIEGIPRVLLRTKNSFLYQQKQFQKEFVSLSLAAAEWLVEKNVFLIGIDYLSIEAYASRNLAVHHFLLSKGVILVEGLMLDKVPTGVYELICAPMKIVDGDGAPARVFLRTL